MRNAMIGVYCHSSRGNDNKIPCENFKYLKQIKEEQDAARKKVLLSEQQTRMAKLDYKEKWVVDFWQMFDTYCTTRPAPEPQLGELAPKGVIIASVQVPICNNAALLHARRDNVLPNFQAEQKLLAAQRGRGAKGTGRGKATGKGKGKGTGKGPGSGKGKGAGKAKGAGSSVPAR